MSTWRHSHNLQQSPTEFLKIAIEGLKHERTHISVQGRALQPDEQDMLRRIEKALPLLEQGLAALEH